MIERGMSETDSERVVSVSPRGQATIPKNFREELGIDAPGRVKFVRREDGEIVVRPIRSVTDLRGILTGETDDEGRSATEMLRDERSRDEEHIEGLRRRYADDRETDSE
jgi:AbrB family looped-hinge helix DNA binding protein